MRFFATVALVATQLMASSDAFAADLVLTMNSYGPVQIGMPVAQAHKLLTKLGRKNLPSPRGVAKVGCGRYQASPELTFMTEDQKIVRIETHEPNVVTPSGLRIGSSLDKVRRSLGSRIEDVQQHGSDNAADRSIVLVSGDKQFAIRVDGNQVAAGLFVGAEHAIRSAEGCS
ncbi:hypothetical protein [Rhizobacter sp. SG703]|uniref:hypothetical protein n=1 Tax=Rhizobacter sp. SG703 TaxID=2587140 RepID=UPI0014466EC2|nr:hypothetical protein [Rhizobacter sp. SG703]